MKNQKMSKAASIAHRKRLQGVPFATKLSPGSHRIAETSDLHKCKTVRLSGHTLKPELAGLIEKTLQEADVSGTEKGAQRTEEDLSCLKEIKKKVYDNKKDKESGREQDESVKVEISEKTKAKSDAEMEDVLLEMKANLSFVEIDLRDRVEEKTEEILTEEKQHEKEEESPETLPESSWLCCFPIWTRQKKRKEKQE
ncbi:probable ATP-dependent RNA helicase ddx47 [Podarcis raffonei]|uniref:probable ATP-dependent RNA helicase ddx47 n=1 Tax=Podarcis raffonei TaxID=65483 RepID=UPI0023299E78|nr:probable ATP-dependent RNA helicase ddx47 [Podarcis raffonei]